MNLLGLGSRPVDISFSLTEREPRRRLRRVKLNNRVVNIPVYVDHEDIAGKVDIALKKPGSRVDHQGVRVEFIGQIESLIERSTVHEFVALSKLLMYPGELASNASLDFAFVDAEKPLESYYGINIRLRYMVRLTMIKRFGNLTAEDDIFVERYSNESKVNSPKISMEVGIEDALHIEFEYLKSSFHLSDVIVGSIYFSLVRIKIKYLELNLVRKEVAGPPIGGVTDSEVVAKYEILDGAPLKGETIPIRLFLAPYDLAPTMKDVLQKFTVSYSINLILVDEEDRRYFKQQDIHLWRRGESEFIKPRERNYPVPPFRPVAETESPEPSSSVKQDDARSGTSGPGGAPNVQTVKNGNAVAGGADSREALDRVNAEEAIAEKVDKGDCDGGKGAEVDGEEDSVKTSDIPKPTGNVEVC